MSFWIGIAAAVAGYLAGSIPFAAIIFRLFGNGDRLQPLALEVPGTSEVLRSETVSATSVRLQLGTRYGCLTSLLDMAKAAAVTLAFRLAYPHKHYFLVAAGLAVVGHVWPIFYRFRGGRGQSPAIGGMFVVDWAAPLIAYPIAQLLGFATQSRAFVGRFSPMLIAAIWLYFRTGDSAFVLYALGVLAIRLLAMRGEVSQIMRLQKAGYLSTLQEEAELLGFDRFLRKLKATCSRIRRKGHY